MKVRIEIDTQTFVRFWLVVIGFALVGLAIYSARTALILLGTALFLALALNRPVSALAQYLPGKSRVASTAISYIAVVAVISAVIFLVIPPIVQQTAKFADSVPGLVDSASQQWSGLNGLIDQYNLRPEVDKAIASAKDNATSLATSIGSNVLSSLGSLASLAASTFLVLVLSFLMLIEGPSWLKRIWTVYHDEKRMQQHRELVQKMYTVVTGYVTGQLTVSTIGGLAAGLAVFALSFFFEVPANLAVPTIAITFVLSLIPMFGATIAGVLITALLAMNDVTAAVIFCIFFIVYQQIENNFIAPVIQSKSVELSALAVLASVTIGLYVFGLAGGIISIPIAGCIKVLIEDRVAKHHAAFGKEKPISKFVQKLQKRSTESPEEA